MSTSVWRYCDPALPAVVSWYATPSPPLSKFSASIKPGMGAAVPPNGVDGGGATTWTETTPDVVLAPAACYPLYPTLAGDLPENGRVVSLTGWVFRHEPSIEPTRMQAFRVREFIRAGTPEMVVEWRDKWLERGVELMHGLGLPTKEEVAADPFFGRAGKIMMDGQKAQKLKFEVLVPVISESDPTACCSFNYHQDKFGSAFGIRAPDGSVAHTACLGFGMERVVMALFQAHGFDPKQWPQAVRDRLWP